MSENCNQFSMSKMTIIGTFLQTLVVSIMFHEIDAQQCSVISYGIRDSDMADILKAHNTIRQKVANNQQNGQPGASNMNQLVWDSDLAAAAQNLANQCKFAHDRPQVAGFNYVGQNLAIWYDLPDNDDTPSWNPAVQMWYDEVTQFSSSWINPFQSAQGTGHYTQLVWATTQRVGCGYSFYQKDGSYSKLYVCNYGEGGNILDTPMYLNGPACSQCNRCSTDYPGLCSA